MLSNTLFNKTDSTKLNEDTVPGAFSEMFSFDSSSAANEADLDLSVDPKLGEFSAMISCCYW